MIRPLGVNTQQAFKADKRTINKETGEYKDIVHPINTETRNKFSQEILQEYNKALTQVG